MTTKIDRALEGLKKALDRRPGTANSDVNALAIEYPVPAWILFDLLSFVENVRLKRGDLAVMLSAWKFWGELTSDLQSELLDCIEYTYFRLSK